MDTKEKKIKAILNGTASPVETLRYLEALSEEDIEQYLPEAERKKVMADYRATNDFISEPAVAVSEAEKEALWQQIKATGLEKTVKEKRSGLLKKAFCYFFAADTRVVTRWVPVMVLLLIIVIPANFYIRQSPEKTRYSGIKGEKELFGSVQYAIMSKDGTLERPERKLTTADTLAFRINVNQTGYFSLFFVYDNQMDTIFLDELFEKGVHDLNTIYQLEGNNGKNTMVLVSGEKPIGTVPTMKSLILNAAKQGLSFITVHDDIYTLVMERMRVETSE